MANSLQEQLLKAGLVDEQRAKQVRHEKRKQTRRQGKRPATDAAEQARRAQAEKAEHDRRLNRARQDAAGKKAITAQIKRLIADNRLSKGDGDIAYNFSDGPRIKRLYVTEPVQRQLGEGAAVIVKLHGQYDIVPKATAEKIRERDADCIIVWNRPGDDGEDPYADFPVPDDLVW